MDRTPWLSYAKEIRELYSVQEVTDLLATGDWLAVLAVPHGDGALYVMIRVR